MAKDSVPMDYVKLLEVRGVLHARAGEWRQAEEDLCNALSLSDRQPDGPQGLLRTLLTNCVYVLRKNHNRRVARSIGARIAALPADRTATVVDVGALFVAKKPPN
jgi:hypothetical protein